MESPAKKLCTGFAVSITDAQSCNALGHAPETVVAVKQGQAALGHCMMPEIDVISMLRQLQEENAKLKAAQAIPPQIDDDIFANLDAIVPLPDMVPTTATPQKVVEYMTLIKEKMPAWVNALEWTALYIKLPVAIKRGTNIPMVSKIEGDRTFKGKKGIVADQVQVGEEPSSAWSLKLGFTVSNTEKTKLSNVWPDVSKLQSFAAKLAGDNRMVAVFFHALGSHAKTPSHYHIIVGHTGPWSKLNVRNELTSTKFCELGFKRYNIVNIAGTMVHHCQPRPEAQFIGATDPKLCNLLYTIRRNWIERVGESPKCRIYNGVGDLVSDEAAPLQVEGWDMPGTTGPAVVEVGVSLHKAASKQTVIIDSYKALLRTIPIKIYSVDQIRASLPSLIRINRSAYDQLRIIYCGDKGQKYRMSLMYDALCELAIERIDTPIEDMIDEVLKGCTTQEIEEVIEALADGPMKYILDLICIGAVILRKSGKMNCALIHGEKGAGKSTVFLNSLSWLRPHWDTKATPNPMMNQFCFSDLAFPQKLAFIDEFGIIAKGTHEHYKVLFGGQSLDTDQKYKGRVQTTPCPFIVMSNNTLAQILGAAPEEQAPFEARVYVFSFRAGELPQVRYNTKFYVILWFALLAIIENAPAPDVIDGATGLKGHYEDIKEDIVNGAIELLFSYQQRINSSCEVSDDWPAVAISEDHAAATSDPEDSCDE